MSYIETTTIQTVAVLLLVLNASTPASAGGRNSELLIDLRQRFEDTCRIAKDTGNPEQRRLCKEYGEEYAIESNSQFRNPNFERWSPYCEERYYVSQGVYGGCTCVQGSLSESYNRGLRYPQTRVGPYGSPSILRDCEYWLCINDEKTLRERSMGSRTLYEEICTKFTPLLEYTKKARSPGGGRHTGSGGFEESERHCVSIVSKIGWQEVDVPVGFHTISKITGSWNVHHAHKQAGPEGYKGALEERMHKQYKKHKFVKNLPFAALLMKDGTYSEITWVKQAPHVFTGKKLFFRINDNDDALSDNRGDLELCFGN